MNVVHFVFVLRQPNRIFVWAISWLTNQSITRSEHSPVGQPASSAPSLHWSLLSQRKILDRHFPSHSIWPGIVHAADVIQRRSYNIQRRTKNNYNNDLIKKIIRNSKVGPLFKRFLVDEAENWLENSKVTNKDVH